MINRLTFLRVFVFSLLALCQISAFAPQSFAQSNNSWILQQQRTQQQNLQRQQQQREMERQRQRERARQEREMRKKQQEMLALKKAQQQEAKRKQQELYNKNMRQNNVVDRRPIKTQRFQPTKLSKSTLQKNKAINHTVKHNTPRKTVTPEKKKDFKDRLKKLALDKKRRDLNKKTKEHSERKRKNALNTAVLIQTSGTNTGASPPKTHASKKQFSESKNSNTKNSKDKTTQKNDGDKKLAHKKNSDKVTKNGTSVLGKYPDYIKLSNELGAKRFSIPTNVWNKMSKAEQWGANKKFLDRMIKRGDNIVLSNPVKNVKDISGAFRKELDYLMGQGFKLSNDGARLIK